MSNGKMVKRISIDGNLIEDIPSFYAEINRVMMQSESWQIGNSLDALNDLLFGEHQIDCLLVVGRIQKLLTDTQGSVEYSLQIAYAK